MKTEVTKIDAKPSKRIYRSIIVDYDLNKSICELIDNAIDLWVKNGKKDEIKIIIDIDISQQSILITDNVGGISYEDLKNIVSPGHTSNSMSEETIGIFGVGSKRAVVALAQLIKITSRYKNNDTYQIEYDDDWLKDEDNWELQVNKVDDIGPSSTKIELLKLRYNISQKSADDLIKHLSEVYAKFFINDNIKIEVNNNEIKPTTFENWSYPPSYLPQKYVFKIFTTYNEFVGVEIIAGLANISSPKGEYGVYIYCNDRLIAKELKDNTVGFEKGVVGSPHPSISLAKVFVFLRGPALLMPWNSSKSGLYDNSEVYKAIREKIVEITKYYTKLSRSLESKWENEVFQYQEGKIVNNYLKDIKDLKLKYLPEIPKSRVSYSDKITSLNNSTSKDKPWTKGLYESIIIADMIYNKKFEQKNRITLIIIDSTLEIALKEFLVNESSNYMGNYYSDLELTKLFAKRHLVIDEIKKYTSVIPKNNKWDKVWNKINYYYGLRCKLVHERATVGITDEQIEDYRKTVEKVLNKLFGLKFEQNSEL